MIIKRENNKFCVYNNLELLQECNDIDQAREYMHKHGELDSLEYDEPVRNLYGDWIEWRFYRGKWEKRVKFKAVA